MSDEGRRHRASPGAGGHRAAAVLHAEAVGLVVIAAACVGAGTVLTAAVALVLAAVAAGLATSIAEGFPGAGAAILGFEGVTTAAVIPPRSLPAAGAVLAATAIAWCWVHHRGGAQIRRPVSFQ